MTKLNYSLVNKTIETFTTTFPLPPATRPTEAGYLYGWGTYNSFNSLSEMIDIDINIPEPDLNTIVAVSTKTYYTMSLDINGQVRMWGSDIIKTSDIFKNMPSDLTDVVAIATENSFAAALINGGRLRLWGNITDYIIPDDLNTKNIVAISSSSTHIAALIDNGSVVIIYDKNNNIVNNIVNNIDQSKNTNIIAVSAAHNFTTVLKADGTLYVFGKDENNQLNTIFLNNIKKISTDNNGGVALDNNNRIVSWDITNINFLNSPPIKDIIYNYGIAFGIKNDNTLISWGSNQYNIQIIPAGITNVITVSPKNFNNVFVITKTKYIPPVLITPTITTPVSGPPEISTPVSGSSEIIIPSDPTITFIKSSYDPLNITTVIFLLPSYVTTIGYGTFRSFTELNNIVIPDSVTTIGATAFAGCTNLKSINIPNKVTIIERATFASCINLTKITLPEGLITIKDKAFAACNFTNFNIPSSVVLIENNAFDECSSLTEINIPDNVSIIDTYTFRKCKNLETVTIGKNVNYIKEGAFYECEKLSVVYINSTLPINVAGDVFAGIKSNAVVYFKQLPAGFNIGDNWNGLIVSQINTITPQSDNNKLKLGLGLGLGLGLPILIIIIILVYFFVIKKRMLINH